MPIEIEAEKLEEQNAHEVVMLGKQIYESRVRALVEPDFINQYVAIHVDSGDYAVDKTTAQATRTLLKTHPIDGRIFLTRIGDEPDYALVARIMAGEMMARQSK